jgi:hypothetical protein
MNRDHAEQTKEIVESSVGVKVTNHLIEEFEVVCNNCCVVFDPGSNKYQMILILLSVITKTKDRCSTRKFCCY